MGELADRPVETLQRVGPKMLERLHKLGIQRVQDLLFHLPLRYQDRSRLRPIASIRPGEEVLVEGLITDAQISYGRRRSLKVWISDESGGLLLRFFYFSRSLVDNLQRGQRIRCFGEVRQGPQSLEMVHPELQSCSGSQSGRPSQPLVTGAQEQALTPVYPSTEGLQQPSWRKLTDQALALLAETPESLRDWVPEALLKPLHLPGLHESLHYLHRPPVGAPVEALRERTHPACQRLAFEEMLAHQLALRRMRAEQRGHPAPSLTSGTPLTERLLEHLPFALTGAQQRVVDELRRDLEASRPMQRLLQGDVGSGKTVVAALAALQAVGAGWQVAIMAPTELLSQQHLRNISAWVEPLGLQVAWISGRHKGAERRAILEKISTGDAQLVVGTHALFQDEVRFARLGLVIIDEQHRFGVHQRLQLREKGAVDGQIPHQLIMTATPIPRSLAMTIYSDLDLSVIDELPPGRTPIQTLAVPDSRREQVLERVRHACLQGRQAYWVCTLVEESEALQAQAAEDTAEMLRQTLPELRIGLVHGRLKADAREPVMRAFADGDLDLLVATTVIEVGVDVPNASLMVIENPERLGLAQLHQLRGRVGRGQVESFCLLLYRPPLGGNARERLDILRRETSGFAIADADLRIRGAGEVLGTRQAGMAHFRLADPQRDQSMLSAAQQGADRLLRDWPQAVDPLIRRWLGDREDYARV